MTDIDTADVSAVRKHFDVEFYIEEYPDVVGYAVPPLVHFCRVGWKEGRNPNPFFDTASYLIDYPDVVRSGLNPYFHFLQYGRFEGRVIAPSFTPSVRSRLVFGHSVHDWPTIIKPSFNVEYYLENLDPELRHRVNPLAHFAYRGWREGLSANPVDDIAELTERYAECAAMMVNPMVAKLLLGAAYPNQDGFDSPSEYWDRTKDSLIDKGNEIASLENSKLIAKHSDELISDLNYEKDLQSHRNDNDVEQDEDALNLVRTSMSTDFYLAKNPDVAAAGQDAAVHYFYTGWMEGRNPDRTFDTNYYLSTNEDVRLAGINPYWHYLVAGRFEGRPARRPGGYLRDVLDSASAPEIRRLAYANQFERMTRRDFGTLISTLTHARSLALSLSHDCYVKVIGGTQIFLADEQAAFNHAGSVYLHLSPLHPQVKLVENTPDFAVVVTVNGTVLGWSTVSGVLEALEASQIVVGRTIMMAVHCVLGWNVSDIIRIANAVKPKRNLFWLHDFSSVCAGYNLLRNDIEFCGAPALESLACRICVYGEERARHVEQVDRLFHAIDFNVISPSDSALELWSKATTLPHSAARVHPHWSFDSIKKVKSKKRTGRIKLAFLGYPSITKGWHHFVDLATDKTIAPLYEFFQFSSSGSESLPEATFISTEVTAEDRFAATRLLERSRIDAVLILSPWPETFSFVLYEAVATGCNILCLADSGNVARYVEKNNCGLVFANACDLKSFLQKDGLSWLRKQRAEDRDNRIIKQTGTSFTALRRLVR